MNRVVPDRKDVLPTALQYAAEISNNSPDSVRSTKLALLLAKEMGMAESFDRHAGAAIAREVDEGENIKEGLLAFNEARYALLVNARVLQLMPACILQKRKPRWKNPRSITVPAKL